MLSIILFAFSVMYTPGPVNILSLNSGAQKHFTKHIPFCLGVATALFLWFALIGYTGNMIISEQVLPYIAVAGISFILYLAYKILTSKVEDITSDDEVALLSFRDGLFMQLLNPKSMLVVFPVAVMQFPTVGISGIWITVWSIGLGLIGFGAPFLYAVAGSFIFKYLTNKVHLKVMNLVMGIMLIAVALDMVYSQFYL